jgi:hypothetical protein
MCPELSTEVSVESVEGAHHVAGPDVGEISPIELYEAGVSEARARFEEGLPSKPRERHPDGHKEDEGDGMDHMFGHRAHLVQRTHVQKKIAPPPKFFQEVLPAPRAPDSDEVSIEVGFKGNWNRISISKKISENEFNEFVSTGLDHPVATTDFVGAPIEDQQFRFYPDVSHGTPMWITLRQGMKRSNLTMIMRISRESNQKEMEEAASFYWDQPVEFKTFPTVFDSTAIYWIRPHTEEPQDPNELPFPEPETLDAIPHVETPTYKPFTCTFPRSLSSDDLKGTPAIPVGGKSADTITKWVVMFGLTRVTYWAPETAPLEIVVSKAAATIGLKPTGWRIRRGDKWNIYCSDSSNVPEASIHFGNIEWRGKVEPTYSNDQLITAAQTQLDIVGTWRVRSSHWEDHVHCIECEQAPDETFRPPLPEESEVHFNFEGCIKKPRFLKERTQLLRPPKLRNWSKKPLFVDRSNTVVIIGRSLSRDPAYFRSRSSTKEARRRFGATIPLTRAFRKKRIEFSDASLISSELLSNQASFLRQRLRSLRRNCRQQNPRRHAVSIRLKLHRHLSRT